MDTAGGGGGGGGGGSFGGGGYIYPFGQAIQVNSQALESDGFQVGTSTNVNTNAETYYGYVMKDTPATTANAGFLSFM